MLERPDECREGHRFDSGILHTVRSQLCAGLVFMEFFVYIIYSKFLDSYYIGSTGDLEDRLFRHNNSGSKYTKKAKDWVLKYTEPFDTNSKAVSREMEIKNKKSRKYIEYLISNQR